MVWGNLIQATTEGHLKTSESFLYWRNACTLRAWPSMGEKKRTSIPFPAFSMRVTGNDKDSYHYHILIITTLTLFPDLLCVRYYFWGFNSFNLCNLVRHISYYYPHFR